MDDTQEFIVVQYYVINYSYDVSRSALQVGHDGTSMGVRWDNVHTNSFWC